jgi:hypothetical protein
VVPPPRPSLIPEECIGSGLDRHATFLDVATRKTLWKPTDARIGDGQT